MFFIVQPQFRNRQRLRPRIHDYSQQIAGRHYFFGAANCEAQSEQFYMTGRGKGIRPQDRILLQEEGQLVLYQVETIEYYCCDTADLWVASLSRSSRCS